MCGIFCSLSTSSPITPSEGILQRLKCRGPDSESSVHVQAKAQGNTACQLVLCSTVLSLRGSHVTGQPYRDPAGKFALCWNGEAWRIDADTSIEDDTVVIHELLSRALEKPSDESTGSNAPHRAQQIAAAISRVAGPYAFALFDCEHGHLYFGRDFLGRRSLCWRTTPAGEFLLCSVTDGLAVHGWQEVEADGVYFLDVMSFSQNQERLAGRVSGHSPATRVPIRFIGEQASVLPRLSLNKTIPMASPSLCYGSPAVAHLHTLLRESLALRTLNVPQPPNHHEEQCQTKLAILFSGGLDCTVLARICHDLLPDNESIDLLNVAFKNPRIHAKLDGGSNAAYELCPDRITGRASFAELQAVCPGRLFRFVAIDIPYTETLQHRDPVISLMHPHNTEMDLSIACALYFAARGTGHVSDPARNTSSEYATPARVLLSGLGADELFGGYTRHATAFQRAGFQGLINELELDVSRLGKRNLGRDDRVISHWGKEARFPFLDEALLTWALNASVNDKCGFGESSSKILDESAKLEPGKKVLRCLAWKLGMRNVAKEKKRAIQFGARTAKMETGKTKGTTTLS